MLKKLLSLVFALLLGAQMYANDVIPANVVPQTEKQREAYQLGQQAVAALLQEAAAKGEVVTQEEVVRAVENAYATVALRNNEKAIWFALGMISLAGVYVVCTKFIIPAWNKWFNKEEASQTETSKDQKKDINVTSKEGDSSKGQATSVPAPERQEEESEHSVAAPVAVAAESVV